MIGPVKKLEEELRDWKEWAVVRMRQLGSELDSLRAQYGLICNSTPEELRAEIESVRFENARLVKLVSESPQELQEELAKVRAENARLTRLFESTPYVNILANETFDNPNLSLGYPLREEEELPEMPGALPDLAVLNEDYQTQRVSL